MGLRYIADDSHMGEMYLRGEVPTSSWLPPLFSIDTGDNGAGNGGNGYFSGSMIDSSYAAFKAFNIAQAGFHATAVANQTNVAYFDQAATQIAGIGGDGGHVNAAIGGSVSGSGGGGSAAIATGDNSAGNGGDGY